jgi:hypothetical protein
MHWAQEDTVRFARACVADLRVAYARYPGDPGIESLVTELNGVSPRFAQMWAEHEVQARRRVVKRIEHPLAGPLEFDCQLLHVPDTDQRLIIYCATPGSPTEAGFRRLAELVPDRAVDVVGDVALMPVAGGGGTGRLEHEDRPAR